MTEPAAAVKAVSSEKSRRCPGASECEGIPKSCASFTISPFDLVRSVAAAYATRMDSPPPTPIMETRIVMSDPTALGVFGLAMVTFVAASQKMGWTTGVSYIIPWALFLGSLAQIWASTIDFR